MGTVFTFLRDLRLPLRLKTIIPPSGLLRGVKCFETDVLGVIIGPIFSGQTVQEEAWLLNMEPIGCSETSISNTLRRVITQKTE